eukprot:7596955-Pyramimonas_sp.AAC.1
MHVAVLTKIADHTELHLPAFLSHLQIEAVTRTSWQCGSAKWRRLNRVISEYSWIDISHPDIVVPCLTQMLKSFMLLYVPGSSADHQVAHPWVNEYFSVQVRKKKEAAGTDGFPQAAADCSASFSREFRSYAAHT